MGEDLDLVGQPHEAVTSTCTALVPVPRLAAPLAVPEAAPPVLADVNGYYRDLGVSPVATSRELTAAWGEHGTNDARITYVFKQLRNPAIRTAYDAVPEGGVFLDDYVLEEMTRQVKLAVANLAAKGIQTTAEEIFSSLGIDIPTCRQDADDQCLDTPDPQGFDESRPVPHQSGRPSDNHWRYAYYRKATTCDDVARLAEWHGGLASALAGCEAVPKFSVGFHHAIGEPFLLEWADGIPVFLLHAEMNPSLGLINWAIATATAAISA